MIWCRWLPIMVLGLDHWRRVESLGLVCACLQMPEEPLSLASCPRAHPHLPAEPGPRVLMSWALGVLEAEPKALVVAAADPRALEVVATGAPPRVRRQDFKLLKKRLRAYVSWSSSRDACPIIDRLKLETLCVCDVRAWWSYPPHHEHVFV